MAGKSTTRKQSEEKIADLDRNRAKERIRVGGELGDQYEKFLEASASAERLRESYVANRAAAIEGAVFTEAELLDLGWPDLTPTGKAKRSPRAPAPQLPNVEPAPQPTEPPLPPGDPQQSVQDNNYPQQTHNYEQRIEEYA